MNEKITVWVNGTAVTINRGMQVKHALIAYGQSIYDTVTRTGQSVRDENGFRIGLEGALADGTRIYVK